MVDELDRLINDLIAIVPDLVKYVDEQSRVDAQALVLLRPEKLQPIAVAAAENNFDLPFAEVLQAAIAPKVQNLNSNPRALYHSSFSESLSPDKQMSKGTSISCPLEDHHCVRAHGHSIGKEKERDPGLTSCCARYSIFT